MIARILRTIALAAFALASVCCSSVVAQIAGGGVGQKGSVTAGDCASWAGNGLIQDAGSSCGSGTGTVTSVSVTTANGVSGSVATPTTTPAISVTLGAITPSSVAIGGATIGGNALAVTGTTALGGNLTVTSASLLTAGNISATAWITNGIRAQMAAASFTDTSSSGTVAAAYTDLFGASTVLALSATTYTNYYGAFFKVPVASTNVTMTNKWALGADSIVSGGLLGTTSAGSAAAPSLFVGNATTGQYSVSTTGLGFTVNGTSQGDWGIGVSGVWSLSGGIVTSGAGSISWSGRARLSSPISGSIELLTTGSANPVFLSNPAAATWQLGQLDAASPVAQMLQVQSVVAGNGNTAGATWTLQGSLSNGSGGGGNIMLATTQSTAASGTQNTALAGITIVGGNQLVEINQITTDAALTDTTVCQDTTLHGLHAGSGTAGICLGNVSSIRFKHDWENIGDGLSVINWLDPGTYRYNAGIADGGTQLRVGFTAERYAQVLPQFTRYDSEGRPNGLDMLAVFPFAVRAIQQLDERLAKMEARQ